jgi:hypothetical protein
MLFYPQEEVIENGPVTMAAVIFCHVNMVKKFLESVTHRINWFFVYVRVLFQLQRLCSIEGDDR